MKKKIFSLLVLLMTAVSGAWAQSTTHVVNQDKVNEIFSGDGYTLGNAVKAGDVLDFQGTIELEGDASHSLVINKAVTVKSSTKDAVLKLHTPAGDRTGKNPGSTFVINADGAGTQVQDIRLENTGMWIFNTSNVTFTGVTFHVEGASVCTGVGHVALRYSDHITFDGCTVYTKDNGGSSCCVLTYSGNCTFKDTHIEGVGKVGNPLYLGNVYNFEDMPSGFTGACNDCVVTGCTIKVGTNSPLSKLMVSGLRHRFENCTVDIGASFSSSVTVMTNGKSSSLSAASADDGYIIRNNTFKQGMSVPAFSTAEGNTITGNVTMSGVNATFTGNQVQGKVTASNKNATIQGNTVISTEEYAVYLNSTAADANNAVKNNVLLGAFREGDDAVYCKKPEVNTVIDNTAKAYDYELTVAKSEHGSGTIKFFIGDYELKGAYEKYEGKTITMTVTPDEGYVVGSVSANAYTTWAGARRKAPAAIPTIPMLGNVTLTPVEGKANTWTFTMPAASVELKVDYLATSNLYLSKEALADKASITVKDGETTVEFDDDGKSTTTVIEGKTVTTKYNGTKKILGMKVVKKAAEKTITIGEQNYTVQKGETWKQFITRNQLSGWSVAQYTGTTWYVYKNKPSYKLRVKSDGINWETLILTSEDAPIDTDKQYTFGYD